MPETQMLLYLDSDIKIYPRLSERRYSYLFFALASDHIDYV